MTTDGGSFPNQPGPPTGPGPVNPPRSGSFPPPGGRSFGHADNPHPPPPGASGPPMPRQPSQSQLFGPPRGPTPTPAGPSADAPSATGHTAVALLLALFLGAAVTVAIGAYAKLHDPQSAAINLAGFSSPIAVKAWLTTLVLALVIVQLGSAAIMYGTKNSPKGIAAVHRWSGRLAVLVSLPVAVHCLFAFGFSDGTTRTLLHSMLGCAVYGVFVAKMILLTPKGIAGWLVPLAGGILFASFLGIWATSSLWFFETSGLTF